MGRGQGIQIETGDGQVKTLVFGWGAVVLGVGVAAAAIALSWWVGVALAVLSGCTGIALICVGVGEGRRRASLGRAAEIAAERGQLPEPARPELPEWTRR